MLEKKHEKKMNNTKINFNLQQYLKLIKNENLISNICKALFVSLLFLVSLFILKYFLIELKLISIDDYNWNKLIYCLTWFIFVLTFIILFFLHHIKEILSREHEHDIFRKNLIITSIAAIIVFIIMLSIKKSDFKLSEQILMTVIFFFGFYTLLFFRNLKEILRSFAKTTTEEIWGKSESNSRSCRISDGLTNAHIASLQFYNLIPKIIIENDKTTCGHVYIRVASFELYAEWINKLLTMDKIYSYDTMNLYSPNSAIGLSSEKPKTVKEIQNLLCNKMKDKATKIQVVDIGDPPLTNNDEFKDWLKNRLKDENSKLRRWLSDDYLAEWMYLNRNIKFYWQFKHILKKYDCFLGEFVVINRDRGNEYYYIPHLPEQTTMVIRYNDEENLLEWLFGNTTKIFTDAFKYLERMNKHIFDNDIYKGVKKLKDKDKYQNKILDNINSLLQESNSLNNIMQFKKYFQIESPYLKNLLYWQQSFNKERKSINLE